MRRPALISLLVALAVVFTAGGCGSRGDDDEDQQAAPIAASAVIEQFHNAPGSPALRAAAHPDVAWEQLSLGLDITPAQEKRFGVFTIYVVEPERDEAVESLLSDKDTAKPLEQAAGGIYWDFDELSDSYVAQKRYGPNVVLTWWNEKPEPVTDARWRRLDRLMQGLVTGQSR